MALGGCPPSVWMEGQSGAAAPSLLTPRPVVPGLRLKGFQRIYVSFFVIPERWRTWQLLTHPAHRIKRRAFFPTGLLPPLTATNKSDARCLPLRSTRRTPKRGDSLRTSLQCQAGMFDHSLQIKPQSRSVLSRQQLASVLCRGIKAKLEFVQRGGAGCMSTG